jgi:hypothetical protein
VGVLCPKLRDFSENASEAEWNRLPARGGHEKQRKRTHVPFFRPLYLVHGFESDVVKARVLSGFREMVAIEAQVPMETTAVEAAVFAIEIDDAEQTVIGTDLVEFSEYALRIVDMMQGQQRDDAIVAFIGKRVREQVASYRLRVCTRQHPSPPVPADTCSSLLYGA